MFMKQIEDQIAAAQRRYEKKLDEKGSARGRRKSKALTKSAPELVLVPEPEPEPGPPEEPNSPPEEPNSPPEEPVARTIGIKVPPEVRANLEKIKEERGIASIKLTALLVLTAGAAALTDK